MVKKKFWNKFLKRKKNKSWKTDCYFGIYGDESFRGHMTISGAKITGEKLADGEIYYLRDICGNTLINKDENGKNLL